MLANQEKTIKILYVAGTPRSGTTLLSRMFGQITGAVNVGEIRSLWQEGWIENRLCECGEHFRNCEFWKDVIIRAFGTNSISEALHIINLQERVNRMRYLPQLFIPALRTKQYSESFQEYKNLLEIFYRAILQVSNAEFIVDSSKHIATAYILSEIANIDLNVIYLIRDSRSVAYSWQRKKKDPANLNFMEVKPVHKAILEWDYINIWGELLKTKIPKYTRLRYEDLVAFPSAFIDEIAKFAEIAPSDSIINKDEIFFKQGHAAVGNPDRFRTGSIKIQLDNAWKVKLSSSNKIFATMLSLPLLYHYKYIGRKNDDSL